MPEFRSEAFGAVKDLVAEGLALSMADLDEVRPWIESGKVFAWNGFEYAMPVQVVALSSRVREPAVATLLDAVARAHLE